MRLPKVPYGWYTEGMKLTKHITTWSSFSSSCVSLLRTER
jgi:hypothetical protein